MQRTINIVLIVLIIVAIGVLGYYMVQPDSEPQTGLVAAGFSTGDGITAAAIHNQEFIQLLQNLKNTKIERSFFETSVFKSLREFGRPLDEQPKGRSNPFAEFGVGNVVPKTQKNEAPSSRQLPSATEGSGSLPAPAPTQ
ncbi:MAG: hypothetical protein Q8P93_00720 [bacterium]|nr:hypothetical protein [bacterium]